MNFSPGSVNHRFITYSDSIGGALVGFKKVSLDPIYCSQLVVRLEQGFWTFACLLSLGGTPVYLNSWDLNSEA